MARLKKGDKAPSFTLPDQHGAPVSLSDFAGKKILLYFYPKANTSGCTAQGQDVRDSREAFDQLGMEAIGVSPDDPEKQKKFDSKYDLGFRLLSDQDNRVAEAYGVWGEKSMYGKKYMGIIRSSFLIDEQGAIMEAWYKIKPKDTAAKALAAARGKS